MEKSGKADVNQRNGGCRHSDFCTLLDDCDDDGDNDDDDDDDDDHHHQQEMEIDPKILLRRWTAVCSEIIERLQSINIVQDPLFKNELIARSQKK